VDRVSHSLQSLYVIADELVSRSLHGSADPQRLRVYPRARRWLGTLSKHAVADVSLPAAIGCIAC